MAKKIKFGKTRSGKIVPLRVAIKTDEDGFFAYAMNGEFAALVFIPTR